MNLYFQTSIIVFANLLLSDILLSQIIENQPYDSSLKKAISSRIINEDEFAPPEIINVVNRIPQIEDNVDISKYQHTDTLLKIINSREDESSTPIIRDVNKGTTSIKNLESNVNFPKTNRKLEHNIRIPSNTGVLTLINHLNSNKQQLYGNRDKNPNYFFGHGSHMKDNMFNQLFNDQKDQTVYTKYGNNPFNSQLIPTFNSNPIYNPHFLKNTPIHNHNGPLQSILSKEQNPFDNSHVNSNLFKEIYNHRSHESFIPESSYSRYNEQSLHHTFSKLGGILTRYETNANDPNTYHGFYTKLPSNNKPNIRLEYNEGDKLTEINDNENDQFEIIFKKLLESTNHPTIENQVLPQSIQETHLFSGLRNLNSYPNTQTKGTKPDQLKKDLKYHFDFRPTLSNNNAIINKEKYMDCNIWCRDEMNNFTCCEKTRDPQEVQQILIKRGDCPTRYICPELPPNELTASCSDDSDCQQTDKCCYDNCLRSYSCQPPLIYKSF